MRKVLSLKDYEEGILNKDRSILARAITLVESSNPDHQKLDPGTFKEAFNRKLESRREWEFQVRLA